MGKQYSIKDFAKLTYVSLRTLRYYDEVGILKPSSRSEAGYRFYTENDAFKLSRILALKAFGYTIKDIKILIEKSDDSIIKALDVQHKVLSSHINQLTQALHASERVKEMFERDGCIRWDVIMHIIRLLQPRDLEEQSFYATYFTEEEIKQMEIVRSRRSPEEQQELYDRWEKLNSIVKKNIYTDPTGKIGQQYAKQYVALFNETFQEYPHIGLKFTKLITSGHAPKVLNFMADTKVYDFLNQAVNFYCMQNNIDLCSLNKKT